MAPKDHCDPEEGIIELFDIVDAPEAVSGKTPEAPDDAAPEDAMPETSAPEQSDEPDEPSGGSGQAVSRYPFENVPDFLDEFDKTPNMTFLPPKAEADGAESDGPEEGRGKEGRDRPAALHEPDEELVRAFEAEMAKAGGTVCKASPEDGHAASDAAELPDAVDERIEQNHADISGVLSAAAESPSCGPAPEDGVADRPASSPDAEPQTEERNGEADVERAEVPLPPETLSPFLPLAAEGIPAEKKDFPALSGVVEERITRLEEALSRLSERVAALEQRVDEAGEASGTEGPGAALSEAIEAVSKEKDALRGEMRALSPEGGASEGEAAEACSPVPSDALYGPRAHAVEAVPFSVVDEAAPSHEGPDLLGLALESLQERVALLERRPALSPDVAGIAQDVLALVRVDMEKAAEEQEAAHRMLEDMQRRVQELEKRPLPQLILPELPDAEAIAADVMSRIRADFDRITAETAARVLREEIARLMGK